MPDDFHSDAWLTWENERIDRAKRGDRGAFAELYRAFARPLYTQMLLPRLGDRALAEDVLAETFRSLLEHIESYEPQGRSVWFWLARVATNKAHDLHRGRSRSERALAGFEELLSVVVTPSLTPRDEVEQAQIHARIRETIARTLGLISPRYRRAIELRLLEDRPREECAVLMDVKLGTFDVLLLRAVRAFRAEWQKTADGDTSKEVP